ncbi:MAG: DUF4013 domain-containing protein [Methanobacteriaceae archaeon]|nr:DUF4013 domain-containing protein [Methanobacteriaceae archaeon]
MYNKIKDGLISGAKDHKSFKELFIDAIRYTFKNPIVFLILGLLLSILQIINNIFNFEINYYLSLSLVLILLIIAIVLSLFEFGYSYFIFETSIEGSSTPPSLEYKKILHHGVKDFSVIFIYLIIMIIIQWFFEYLVSIPVYKPYSSILLLLSSIIGGFIVLIINISLINLASNKGNFKSAFNFKEILKITYHIGILRFVLILLMLDFLNFILLDLLAFELSLIGYIYRLLALFIFAPAVLLFSKRFLIMSAMY